VPEACLSGARSLGKVSHQLPNKFLGLFFEAHVDDAMTAQLQVCDSSFGIPS